MSRKINIANGLSHVVTLAKQWIDKVPVNKKERKYECLSTCRDKEHASIMEYGGRGMIVREKGNPDGQLYYVDSLSDPTKFEGKEYATIGHYGVMKLRKDFPIGDLLGTKDVAGLIDATGKWDIKDVIPFFDGHPDPEIDE
ncbi:MAG: hypothetical protein WC612_05185 [Bdellovibrionales bacterium]|jgi:hypothetical protein